MIFATIILTGLLYYFRTLLEYYCQATVLGTYAGLARGQIVFLLLTRDQALWHLYAKVLLRTHKSFISSCLSAVV